MKRTNQKGITLIALIVTIIVLIIIAGISIATLTADNGVLRQTNSAKVENIEGTAREQVKLGCSAMRLAIAEAQALDNSYKASDNRDKIRDVLLSTIQADTTVLEKDGWSAANDTTANVFKITYAGDDYKQACNDDNAEIVYTITLGQKSIEITNETNATLKDQNGNNVDLDIGGSTGTGSGGAEDPDDTPSIPAGLYDANDVMIASWDELVNTYGMDVTKDLGLFSFSTNVNSPYYVLTNNIELANGVKLVIDENITSVGDFAFCSTSLTNITIPDSVTSIGQYAFQRCTSLTSITIPDGVTSIGVNAFKNCTNLKTAYYEGTLEQWCNITFTDIAANPCRNGAALYINGDLAGDITIPDTITEIKPYTFSGCTSLQSITIPDEVTVFTGSEYGIFGNCTNLKTVYYEGTLKQWCNIVFTHVNSNPCCNGAMLYIDGELADDIIIPDAVTEIKPHTFYGCTSLTSMIIPDSITNIGNTAFSSCTNLKTVTFSENNQLKTIGKGTFSSCKNLTSITIPDGVTSIDNNAFKGCTSLESVVIPASVTSIGSEAFYYYEAFTNVTILATEPPTLGSSLFNFNNIRKITVPTGCADAYKAASGWSDYASKIVEAQ